MRRENSGCNGGRQAKRRGGRGGFGGEKGGRYVLPRLAEIIELVDRQSGLSEYAPQGFHRYLSMARDDHRTDAFGGSK